MLSKSLCSALVSHMLTLLENANIFRKMLKFRKSQVFCPGNVRSSVSRFVETQNLSRFSGVELVGNVSIFIIFQHFQCSNKLVT